ncbi:polysaccharide deacetylase, partial [Klebsiella pneumoniae]|nr:polysaccharide deacetylase [Klebsiella pneumoniae]
VLMYHDAVAVRDRSAVWFDTTPAEFAADLGFLRAHGAHFITLDQLHRHLTLGAPLPQNPVALTFDDGYRGFYTYIYPVLKREKIPAAMFVHTDY